MIEREVNKSKDLSERRKNASFHLTQTPLSKKLGQKVNLPKFNLSKVRTKISARYLILIGIVILIIFVFFWLYIRPANERKSCNAKALIYAKSKYSNDISIRAYDDYYKICLHRNGL